MKRVLSLMFSILLSNVALYSQADWLPSSDARHATAEKVYNEIIQAIGDKRKPAPVFGLSTGSHYVAFMDYKQNRIGLETKAYEVCRSLGRDSLNAIAFLLGHELTHYYQDHNWVKHFGSAYASLEIGKKIKELKLAPGKMEECETQADHLGGIYCHMAGYNSLGVGPKLLDAIYAAYDLDEEISGYPSLEERKELIAISENNLRELVPVFDVALCFYAMQDYDEAIDLFEHVITSFQSREIYNNLAVCYAQSALNLLGNETVKYVYPFELDAESRLTNDHRGEGDAEAARIKLEKAARHIESAMALDKDYFTAQINNIAILSLQQKSDEADVALYKAKKLNGKGRGGSKSEKLAVLEAILLHQAGEEDSAFSLLRELKGNDLAELNLKLFMGEELALSEPMGFAQQKEKIYGKTAVDFAYDMAGGNDHTSLALSQGRKQLHFEPVECAMTYLHQSKQNISLVAVGEDYLDGNSKAIKIGDQSTEIITRLGLPNARTSNLSGEIWHYIASKSLYYVDANGLVEQWVLYDVF